MLTVRVNCGDFSKEILIVQNGMCVEQIWDIVEQKTELKRSNFYMKKNYTLVADNEFLQNGIITINPKIFGGKGGFGSMLRAIGAQIEKTTNREACRDLSGRRLRDINEEKRVKAYLEKQSEREEEAAARKKKKLEKLLSTPKIEFKDEKYEKERSQMTEKISEAVEEGFKNLDSSPGGKRKNEEEPILKKKKRKTLLDDDSDLDLDEISDSDSSDEESSCSQISKNSSDIIKEKKNRKEGISSVQDIDEDSGKSTDCSDFERGSEKKSQV